MDGVTHSWPRRKLNMGLTNKLSDRFGETASWSLLVSNIVTVTPNFPILSRGLLIISEHLSLSPFLFVCEML